VLDPCKSDNSSCLSGDQCCGGFCQPAGADGGVSDGGSNLVCGNKPPNYTCSAPQESCETSANCCNPSNTCVNGFCAINL
jgi:hypothetical protein